MLEPTDLELGRGGGRRARRPERRRQVDPARNPRRGAAAERRERRRRRAIGWMPQRPALYGRLTPRENLELFARLAGLADVGAAVDRALAEVGLAVEDRRAAELSVGNQQRLNLAIGLLGEPSVLLLDEPTASLDARRRGGLWELVARVREAGGGVLFATHNLDEARRVADRLLVLEEGRLVYDGVARGVPRVRAIRLLLGKDLRLLRRSPALAGALIVYPLVVALLVGLVVRYAGERPRVALVAPAGLPSVIVVGKQTFDLQQLFDNAKEVKLVRMPAAQAEHQLSSGQVLAMLTVPKDFTSELRGLKQSPKLILRTTSGGLSTRVVEKLRSFVYSTNLDLQQAYIQANLSAVDLLLHGGGGTIGQHEVQPARSPPRAGRARRARALARSRDRGAREEARRLHGPARRRGRPGRHLPPGDREPDPARPRLAGRALVAPLRAGAGLRAGARARVRGGAARRGRDRRRAGGERARAARRRSRRVRPAGGGEDRVRDAGRGRARAAARARVRSHRRSRPRLGRPAVAAPAAPRGRAPARGGGVRRLRSPRRRARARGRDGDAVRVPRRACRSRSSRSSRTGRRPW